ncbi:MAG: FecR domain-containing protein [Gammaproteobacteria bacterium]|nr:FecR domain-containing protein [Gammaproteobacteria bacterium]
MLKSTLNLNFFCTILIVSTLAMPVSAGNDIIARIKVVTGDVTVISAGKQHTVKPGTELRESDTIVTGGNSSVGITFRDDSRTSLGPNTEIQVTHFRFEPARSEYSFVTRIVKGSLMFVSGLISKLSPETARLETPTATLGIRGTRFLLRVEGE